jgi:hypothetical protein
MNSQMRSPSSPPPRLEQEPTPRRRQIQIPPLLLTPLGQMATVVTLAILALPLLAVILLLMTLELILKTAQHLANRLRRLRTGPPTP